VQVQSSTSADSTANQSEKKESSSGNSDKSAKDEKSAPAPAAAAAAASSAVAAPEPEHETEKTQSKYPFSAEQQSRLEQASGGEWVDVPGSHYEYSRARVVVKQLLATLSWAKRNTDERVFGLLERVLLGEHRKGAGEAHILTSIVVRNYGLRDRKVWLRLFGVDSQSGRTVPLAWVERHVDDASSPAPTPELMTAATADGSAFEEQEKSNAETREQELQHLNLEGGDGDRDGDGQGESNGEDGEWTDAAAGNGSDADEKAKPARGSKRRQSHITGSGKPKKPRPTPGGPATAAKARHSHLPGPGQQPSRAGGSSIVNEPGAPPTGSGALSPAIGGMLAQVMTVLNGVQRTSASIEQRLVALEHPSATASSASAEPQSTAVSASGMMVPHSASPRAVVSSVAGPGEAMPFGFLSTATASAASTAPAAPAASASATVIPCSRRPTPSASSATRRCRPRQPAGSGASLHADRFH
jgi:hypothetical protein